MNDVMLPEIAMQKHILKARCDQHRAQAFESELNASLNEVQIKHAASKAEKKQLQEQASLMRKQARQLYACAAECQRQLDALPKEEEAPEIEPAAGDE